MKVITIINQKGGVAKTATAQALGAGLQLRGRKTLLVDIDPQSSLTFDTGADITGLKNILNVLTGEATAADSIQTTAQGMNILAAVPELSGIDYLIKGTNKEYRLKEALEPISPQYDYCVIDTPPTLGMLSVQALTATDGVIIPAIADPHSILGVGLLYDTMQGIQQNCNNKLQLLGILVTMYNGRTILTRDMMYNLQAVAEQIGTKLFDTPIRNNIAVAEAQARRQDIFTYAPRSNAAKDYGKLVDYIINYYEK